MSGGWKLASTAVVWVMVAMILILALPTNEEAAVAMTLILGIGATYSMRYIWVGAESEEQKAQKAKRSRRVSRLMSDLDEDELHDLEAWVDARRDDRLAGN